MALKTYIREVTIRVATEAVCEEQADEQIEQLVLTIDKTVKSNKIIITQCITKKKLRPEYNLIF
jgi:hypothetical protein